MRDDAWTIDTDHKAVCDTPLTEEVWAEGVKVKYLKGTHGGSTVYYTNDIVGVVERWDWLMEVCTPFRESKDD